MDNTTKSSWATWLTTIGFALGAGGGTTLTLPTGLPAWVGVVLSVLGIIAYAVGNQLKHQVTNAVTTQSSDTSIVVKTAQATGQLPPTPVIVPVPVEPTKP